LRDLCGVRFDRFFDLSVCGRRVVTHRFVLCYHIVADDLYFGCSTPEEAVVQLFQLSIGAGLLTLQKGSRIAYTQVVQEPSLDPDQICVLDERLGRKRVDERLGACRDLVGVALSQFHRIPGEALRAVWAQDECPYAVRFVAIDPLDVVNSVVRLRGEDSGDEALLVEEKVRSDSVVVLDCGGELCDELLAALGCGQIGTYDHCGLRFWLVGRNEN
jgi:hypothetical protein